MTKDTDAQDNGLPDDINRWGHAQSMFGLILDQTRDGIIVQSVDGRIEWVNPAYERLFGWTLDEIRGRKPQEFVLPPETRMTTAQIDAFHYDLNGPDFDDYELVENIRRDGSRFWNQLSFARLRLGRDVHQQKIVVTCRDVTQQIETEFALREIKDDLETTAHSDDLTGLANRKRLAEFLSRDLIVDRIAKRAVGALVIDIDKFKEINDTQGHAAGDAALCHVAQALRAVSGPHDLACRTGGDEFLLICPGLSSAEAILTRAELVRRRIAQPLTWDDQRLSIGVSVGTALPSDNTSTGETLIQQADQALYAAKTSGRGRVVSYTDRLGRRYRAQQTLARDLNSAVEQGQFTVHLQPQLDLRAGRITGCEALLRWSHPTRGLLAPGDFLDTAAKTRLLTDIDYQSMNLALDALKQLHTAGFPDLEMSINVSGAILADVNYPGLLDWAVQSRDLSTGQVCIEILETTMLEDGKTSVAAAVGRLRTLGVRVALDDFGTGYAGLAHMSAFDIDAIKLDRSMIARLDHDSRNQTIIRAIVRLCAVLGMDVVAEGVETRDQLDQLRHANCPIIQGYGLAHPMPVADMIGWLRDFDQHGLPAKLQRAPAKQPATRP